MMNINTIIFNEFETLDVFGPIEIFGRLSEYFNVGFFSENGGIIQSSQNVKIVTDNFSKLISENNILLIPGGKGTRKLVENIKYIKLLKSFSLDSLYILTVCTGSVLFSKTGLLDNKNATTNKKAFFWACIESPGVNWIKKARWIKDGNIYTSSGVSAGIDMTFGFISDILGYKIAKKQSIEIEYDWKEDNHWDPFSELYM